MVCEMMYFMWFVVWYVGFCIICLQLYDLWDVVSFVGFCMLREL